MKSIQERAEWFADTFIESLTHGVAYRGYMLGATDQRAIDIQKACEWLKKHSEFWVYDDGFDCVKDMIDNFRKAMEE